MSRNWYAAFNEDFVEQARKIFKSLNEDVIVTVWDPELVPEMLRRGVSVILGRGATAERIRRTVELPVVDIPIPFEDMADTLIAASCCGKQIGVIGYQEQGIDVIVGGLIQTRYARELGLPAVRIELTEKSLSCACNEAEKFSHSLI